MAQNEERLRNRCFKGLERLRDILSDGPSVPEQKLLERIQKRTFAIETKKRAIGSTPIRGVDQQSDRQRKRNAELGVLEARLAKKRAELQTLESKAQVKRTEIQAAEAALANKLAQVEQATASEQRKAADTEQRREKIRLLELEREGLQQLLREVQEKQLARVKRATPFLHTCLDLGLINLGDRIALEEKCREWLKEHEQDAE
jgi:flagellar biosynthesis GTPase FlhF